MPNIEELFNSMAAAVVFLKLDCESGFHQINMNKDDISKTAFSCRDRSFEFIKMPFGLKNAPATF